MDTEKPKRGRPPGKKLSSIEKDLAKAEENQRKRLERKRTGTRRNWRPRDTQIVLLDLTGEFTVKEIAEKFGLSVPTVTAILKDPQGEIVRTEISARIRKEIEDEYVGSLAELAKLAKERIKETLEAHISPAHPAKANQDRVALRILEGTGVLRGSIDDSDTERSLGDRLNPQLQGLLVEALEKANRVREIEAIPIAEHVLLPAGKEMPNGNGQDGK